MKHDKLKARETLFTNTFFVEWLHKKGSDGNRPIEKHVSSHGDDLHGCSLTVSQPPQHHT